MPDAVPTDHHRDINAHLVAAVAVVVHLRSLREQLIRIIVTPTEEVEVAVRDARRSRTAPGDVDAAGRRSAPVTVSADSRPVAEQLVPIIIIAFSIFIAHRLQVTLFKDADKK